MSRRFTTYTFDWQRTHALDGKPRMTREVCQASSKEEVARIFGDRSLLKSTSVSGNNATDSEHAIARSKPETLFYRFQGEKQWYEATASAIPLEASQPDNGGTKPAVPNEKKVGTHWSQADLDLLRSRTFSDVELAERFGRTPSGIAHKRRSLGIPQLTPEEYRALVVARMETEGAVAPVRDAEQAAVLEVEPATRQIEQVFTADPEPEDGPTAMAMNPVDTI